MAKDKLVDYDSTASNNLDVGGISVAEGMLPSNVNNAIREQMSHLKDFAEGTQPINALAVDNLNMDGNTISSTDTNGNITLAPNGTGVVALSSTDLTFGDNDKAIFGAGSDLQIYSNAGESYILEGGTGHLNIRANSLYLENAAGDNYLAGVNGGGTYVYYAGSPKLETTITGIDVTGTAVTDGLTVAGNVSVDGGTIKLDGNYPVGTGNVALGDTAFDAVTSGIQNTAIGANSMTANTSGTNNTAVGRSSLASNISGSELTAVGTNVLSNNTGSYNTAFGSSALLSNSTASYNTALGYQAGYSNTTGQSSVSIGYRAGYSHTTNGQNTIIGYDAGFYCTGYLNTFVGFGSGSSMTTGNNNTILGRFDGNSGGLDIRTSSNNIVLSDGDGNPKGRYISSASRWEFEVGQPAFLSFYVKNTTGSDPYGIYQQFANTSPDNNTNYFMAFDDSTARRFVVHSSGDVQNHDNSYSGISDIKLKEQITDASSQWEDIKALTVRKYKMKTDVATGDSDAHWRLGLVAQEVEAAGMSGLVLDNPDLDENNNDLGTTTKAVKYSILYMKAVKALQEAMERIETLEDKVAALES